MIKFFIFIFDYADRHKYNVSMWMNIVDVLQEIHSA